MQLKVCIVPHLWIISCLYSYVFLAWFFNVFNWPWALLALSQVRANVRRWVHIYVGWMVIRAMSTLLVPIELLKYEPEGLGEIIVFYHYMYVLQLWSLVYITQWAFLSWKSATLILVTRVKWLLRQDLRFFWKMIQFWQSTKRRISQCHLSYFVVHLQLIVTYTGINKLCSSKTQPNEERYVLKLHAIQ